MKHSSGNIDHREIQKFSKSADDWWNTGGVFRGLHEMNPMRTTYITQRVPVAGKTILDVGCGGGILCEALANKGGRVTGIDMNDAALSIARRHVKRSGLYIDYRRISAGMLEKEGSRFDIVTCMEVLEHVPDPAALIMSCGKLLNPGGSLFISTINRSPLSFLLVIAVSEYVLGLTEKNTHSYHKFIKPSEIKTWARQAGLPVDDISGIFYIPYIPVCIRTPIAAVNYIGHLSTGNRAIAGVAGEHT
ncbi:MAG: bifunctional 2-polyprenyl-6-hydroxyphenol methylase/3-demethylubiquinol 3-O-methyltransferase UbiG [Desulfobacterales bacterium]